MKDKEIFLKPLFIQRLGALLIDILVVSLIAGLISGFFMDVKSIEKLETSLLEVSEEYLAGEINTNTYFTEYISVGYQIAQKQGILYLATLFVSVLYFIVYQFYNDGQTIGKRLFKIRVVSIDDGEMSMNTLIFRAMVANSILVDMLILLFITVGNMNIYFYGAICVEFLEFLVILISGLLVMWSKSGRGLHDYIAKTKVVRIDGVKENVLCEN